MKYGLDYKDELKKERFINLKANGSLKETGALTLDLNYLIAQCFGMGKYITDLNLKDLESLEPHFSKDKNVFREFFSYLQN